MACLRARPTRLAVYVESARRSKALVQQRCRRAGRWGQQWRSARARRVRGAPSTVELVASSTWSTKSTESHSCQK